MHTEEFNNKADSLVFLTGILFTSMSTLFLEITLTRILSIMIWYHFAFMVISIVLLGFGASGTYLSLSQFARKSDPWRFLSFSSSLFSLSTIGSYIILRTVTLDPFQIIADKTNFFSLFLIYFLLIIPFFFAGTTIGTAFMRRPRMASSIYFADLFGASLGCLAIVILIGKAGGPGCVAVSAIIAAAGSLLFAIRSAKKGVIIPALLMLILAGAVLSVSGNLEVRPCPSKQYASYNDYLERGQLKVKFSEWNPISRVDVIGPGVRGMQSRFGLYTLSKTYRGLFPNQMFLTIDGDAGTILHNFNGDFKTVEMLDYSLYPAVYYLKDKPKALLIGLGGGTDILTALKYDASSITGVEINPSIVKVGKIVMNDFIGGIFNDEKVTIVNTEGRSFVRHSGEKFDVIQLTGVDTWSALASGAYTLSENYLYTVEAFEDYLSHLQDDGVLSIIRFVFNPPRETLRLCSLAIHTLDRLGLGNARDHIAVLSNGPFASFLLKKSPLLARDKQALIDYCSERGLDVLYVPGGNGDNAFYKLLQSRDTDSFYEKYKYNITPVTDDNPFFYKYYKWSNLSLSTEGVGGQIGANLPMGRIVLIALFFQAAILSVVFIVLPLYLFKRSGLVKKGRGRILLYFAGLGMGFMFLEITVIQKFVLFLGHPTYSISVVLFSILFGSCMGSLISGRLRVSTNTLLTGAIAAIALLTILHVFALPHVFTAFLGKSLQFRILLSIISIVPLGFAMGIPFPTGIRSIGQRTPQMVPWAWGVNGCLSVLGSILSVLLSMQTGFTTVMVLSILVYGTALLSMLSYLKIPEPGLP